MVAHLDLLKKRDTRTLKNMKRNKYIHRIGSFNCQGIVTSTAKQQLLADDFEKYNMTALAIQETHIIGYGSIRITSNSNKTYIL